MSSLIGDWTKSIYHTLLTVKAIVVSSAIYTLT